MDDVLPHQGGIAQMIPLTELRDQRPQLSIA
jgi:hypothetical protein